MHPQRAALGAGAQALGLALDERQIDRLLAYLDLLLKWNRVYNLTALRDPADMLTHHVLDSLALIAPLRAHAGGRALRLLDVGSGGGLPGVVIAIGCPGIDVTCVDAVGKKAAFVQQVAGALGLANLHGQHGRVEAITGRFDVVTSRAFASLADFTAWSDGALAEGGVWLAMKGRRPDDEIAALPPAVTVFHVEPLTVPGLEAERCLVWLRRAG
ncbi:MAG: 16S rRNA (guanine(527)-N(7))-methyltransferase RsmG [Rubrivivax sp.]|uniref:16S rRNA (guanine(527)-N(7))-methyltransferase RsmG n=1 Tax=Ottowia sp. TaxID=1898956 RepID=UPI0011D5D02B|nr:16S rRNA (guanine(527)-N(7))-methyltransferase RsmG [Ottowia sp.]MCC6812577.1 16S rRNA (guanine(527)-N(7))-methyltransferase RsmG [Rubrivivax sp.]TXI17010.1 MAG: 16S rRNA (guanine(527)-N(7))-methyltransferase RsmG [Ottowia sp.]HNE61114.1 16S rRNA (guanine(527)-N(7))-methyltransferase RsmG [Ottowia sp.]HNI86285.1 16S rRNA (guanine(527)-N(7))-methyltransferase RsmG [Ottowia sp.]HNJ45329.1 16S rRNA (guanine(527)-N(7))-methyltransferase RsmG [Ottowia sp.]